MNPLSLVLKPSGGGARQAVTVSNEGNEPIALQFSVTTRQQVNNKVLPANVTAGIYQDILTLTVSTQ